MARSGSRPPGRRSSDRNPSKRKGCSRSKIAIGSSSRPYGCWNRGFADKEGMTKMRKINTICAGIDTSKAKLDVAIEREIERLQVNNDADGHRALSAWL